MNAGIYLDRFHRVISNIMLNLMETGTRWIPLFFIFCNGLYRANGVDIGYHCLTDNDCQTGNGGQYSRCNRITSACMCLYDYLGREKKIESHEDHQKCKHTNECNKQTGCRVKCLPEEEGNGLNYEDETSIFCSSEANCTVGWTLSDLWRWDPDKDWYWSRHQQPLVADFIPEVKTSVCFDPDRAANSLPKGFVIKTSDIPDAGLGVFADVFIPRGTIIGPYKGKRVKNDVINEDYSWKIKIHNSNVQWKVDASDQTVSNWVRYINNPNPAYQQNFAPLIHDGEVFYYAFRSIQPGAELSVWYGDSFAAKLGMKKYEKIRYVSAKIGHVGGNCLGKQFEQKYGFRCFVENSVCMSVVCLCKKGSYARGSECIIDETVGGRCYGKNGEDCLNDKNAECLNGICTCKTNTSQLNKECIQDETYGGKCTNVTGDCVIDSNAECVHGTCQCKYGSSSMVSGRCVTDGTVGGLCIGENGKDCLHDSNAKCFDGFCLCKEGTHQVGQKCQRVY